MHDFLERSALHQKPSQEQRKASQWNVDCALAITSGFPIQIASHIDRHLHPFTTSLASKTLGGSTASKRTISPPAAVGRFPAAVSATPSTSLTGPPWWSCRYEEIISDPSDGGMFHNSFTHDTCQPVHHPLFHILRIHLWVVAHVLQNLAAPQRIGAQIPHLHPRIHPLKMPGALLRQLFASVALIEGPNQLVKFAQET